MEPARFDQLAKAFLAVGSRRRLLGGGISGAAAALGARLGFVRAQGSLIPCPPLFEPCPDDPEACCLIPDPCEKCQVHEICTGSECIGPIFEDRVTCVAGEENGFVTRDVVVASADGRLTLVARTITQRAEAGYGEEGRVRLTLAVNEGRTPQVQIDAVASRAHGITLTAEYGPAFAGVRTLTFQSAPGKDPVIDIDNRGAGATPALSVDPAFVTAAGELETVLSGDLRACFAGELEASPVAGSPVPAGQATCQTCYDVCLEELDACIAQGGATCLTHPTTLACTEIVVRCTEAWDRCAAGCPGGTNC